jgi:hypothetical protein
MKIRLHKDLGVNPKMITGLCPICGKEFETGQIIMLGHANYRDKCPLCEMWVIGGVTAGDECPACGNPRIAYNPWEREKLDEGMSVPVKRVCPDCTLMLDRGVVLIEIRDGERDQNPFRTGKLYCITDEAARERGIEDKVVYIEASTAEGMGLAQAKPLSEAVEELGEET